MDDWDKKDELWRLMGKVSRPEPSQWLVANIVREARKSHETSWFGERVKAFKTMWVGVVAIAVLFAFLPVFYITPTKQPAADMDEVAEVKPAKAAWDEDAVLNALDAFEEHEKEGLWLADL